MKKCLILLPNKTNKKDRENLLPEEAAREPIPFMLKRPII